MKKPKKPAGFFKKLSNLRLILWNIEKIDQTGRVFLKFNPPNIYLVLLTFCIP